MNDLCHIHDLPATNSAQVSAPAPHAMLPAALLDEIGCGLIICDGDGVMRYANLGARHELAAAQLLAAAGGRLQRCEGVSGELDTALRLGVAKGRRSLVLLTRGHDRLMVTTLPCRLPGVEQPLVLVMLGRRQPCSELGLEMLAASYGLTLAERRVLAGLVREAKPREIADENDVKLSTVRTQICSIRAKLGARSIEGLLLRAAEMPPVASALRMAFSGVSAAQPPVPLRAAA